MNGNDPTPFKILSLAKRKKNQSRHDNPHYIMKGRRFALPLFVLKRLCLYAYRHFLFLLPLPFLSSPFSLSPSLFSFSSVRHFLLLLHLPLFLPFSLSHQSATFSSPSSLSSSFLSFSLVLIRYGGGNFSSLFPFSFNFLSRQFSS